MTYTKGKKGEDRFYSDDDVPIYPLNDGFVGEPKKITLKAGEMLVDRYGPVYGGYVSPKNVSFEERALPRTTSKTLYNVFVIKKRHSRCSERISSCLVWGSWRRNPI